MLIKVDPNRFISDSRANKYNPVDKKHIYQTKLSINTPGIKLYLEIEIFLDIYKHLQRLKSAALNISEQHHQATEISNEAEAQIAELYRQIGQLKVERDFLADRPAR